MAIPLWAVLAGTTLLKGMSDEENRKRDLQSNVITQRYSPWTGQNADFSSIGKNNWGSTLLQGAGAYMTAKKEAQDAADKDVAPVTPDRAGGVTQMSKDYLSMPEKGVAKSSFPSRVPATTQAPVHVAAPIPQSPSSNLGDLFQGRMSAETPLMLQGRSPEAMPDYWSQLAGMKSAPYSRPAPTSSVPSLATSSGWARFK